MSFGRNHSKDITFLLRFLLPQRKLGMPLDFCSDSFFFPKCCMSFLLTNKKSPPPKRGLISGFLISTKIWKLFFGWSFFGDFLMLQYFSKSLILCMISETKILCFFLQIHGLLSNILQRIAGPCVFLDSWHPEADFERLERQEEAACEASCLDGFWAKPRFRVSKPTNIGGKSLIQKLLHPWKLT